MNQPPSADHGISSILLKACASTNQHDHHQLKPDLCNLSAPGRAMSATVSSGFRKFNVDQDRHNPRYYDNRDLFPHCHEPKLTPFSLVVGLRGLQPVLSTRARAQASSTERLELRGARVQKWAAGEAGHTVGNCTEGAFPGFGRGREHGDFQHRERGFVAFASFFAPGQVGEDRPDRCKPVGEGDRHSSLSDSPGPDNSWKEGSERPIRRRVRWPPRAQPVKSLELPPPTPARP
jgi:hypothetical protein